MRIAESQIPHESSETLSLLSYQNCRKHIEENFSRLKSLDQIAAEWLEQPGALVKQVAERAGFRDQFHFSRAFKNVLGVSPNTFRRLR